MRLKFHDYNTYMLLLQVCKPYGIDPSSSLEAEDFFCDLLSQYTSSPDSESITAWLKTQIKTSFVTLNGYPKWIQNDEWPFANGKPMVFATQIDFSVDSGPPVSEVYHDDTSLYFFIGKDVDSRVITQQY